MLGGPASAMEHLARRSATNICDPDPTSLLASFIPRACASHTWDGCILQKQELIQLHALLAQVRHRLENEGLVTDRNFSDYDSMRITPVHVFRDREAHKEAFFTLANAISSALQTKGGPPIAPATPASEQQLVRAR